MRLRADYMRRCVELAEVAQRHGDAPVGALIVKANQIIAEGVECVGTRLDVTAHAEIEAIRTACQALESLDLTGCVLYTTAEPCWMCSYAIRQAGIREVVIGAPVPQVGGATSVYPILSDSQIGRWPTPPKIVWSTLSPGSDTLQQKQKVGDLGEDI